MWGRCQAAMKTNLFQRQTFNLGRIRSFASHQLVRAERRQYNALDIEKAYVGLALDLPYEVTIGEGWRELWASCFYSPARIYSSKTFAQKLGFEHQLLPFNFLFNQTVGMSHVDETREVLDLGFSNGIYVKPAFAGQTFNKQFVIKRIRTSKNGEDSILTFRCNLLNAETKELVFTVDKTMLFRGLVNHKQQPPEPTSQTSLIRSSVYEKICSNSGYLPMEVVTTTVFQNQLILHGISKPLGSSNSMSLSSLFGMTHPTIFNTAKFGKEGLVVPGALVVSMAISAASRELAEVLYNDIENVQFYNKTSPVDTVGAMTFVHSINKVGADLEQLTVTTVGVKNVDMAELDDVEIPVKLFTGAHTAAGLEELIAEHCPQLSGKVLLTTRRRLLRQASLRAYSMPLL